MNRLAGLELLQISQCSGVREPACRLMLSGQAYESYAARSLRRARGKFELTLRTSLICVHTAPADARLCLGLRQCLKVAG